jgi:hypothetical protein
VYSVRVSESSPFPIWRLFAPLKGATRFFGDPDYAAKLNTTASRFVLLLLICAGIATALDALGRWITADVRAAVDRPSAAPHPGPLLSTPYSEIAAGLAFVLIWLTYTFLFAALRNGAAKLFFRDVSAPSYASQATYAIFAAVPLLIGALLARALSLTTLPVNPANASLPPTSAVWLPPVLLVLALIGEAWILSRALILRHKGRAAPAFIVWAAPLIFFTALFALYLFVFAVWNYPA